MPILDYPLLFLLLLLLLLLPPLPARASTPAAAFEHPFVILDADAVGRVVGAASASAARSVASPASPAADDAAAPICCSTNYSVAFDPSGRLLAVAVDNLLCPEYLASLRQDILHGARPPHPWETMDDVQRRLDARWSRMDAVFDPMKFSLPPVYNGRFPGVTKTLPARHTAGVRECLGRSLPADVFAEFLDAKNGLVLNTTGLERRQDLVEMPVHANDPRGINNFLLPKYGSFAGSLALSPGQVLPTQSAPHSDGTDGLASILTLTADAKYQRSGTALMRQKTTGVSRVDNETIGFEVSREDRQKMRDALCDGANVYSGYLNSSNNRYAETILRVHNRVNRIVMYPQSHLHNAFLPDKALLSPDPATGRLTMNMFWALLTSGSDQSDGRGHAWFCAERNSSEAVCNGWRDCKWCPASRRCIPSFNSAVLSSSFAPVDVCPPSVSEFIEVVEEEEEEAEAEGVGEAEEEGGAAGGVAVAEAKPAKATDVTDNKNSNNNTAAPDASTTEKKPQQINLFLSDLRKRLVNLMRSILSDVPNHSTAASPSMDLMEWNNHRVKRGLGSSTPDKVFLFEAVDAITPGVLRNVYKMATQGGADIHSLTAAGQNALHFSAAIGASALANFLVAAGVDPYAKDVYGRTPAMVAEWQGYTFDPKSRPALRRSATKPVLLRSSRNQTTIGNDGGIDAGSRRQARATPLPMYTDRTGGGGGWDESVFMGKGVDYNDEQCDIYSVQASTFTPAQFLEHVVLRSQPVLLRRALIDDHDGPWRALREWTRPKLRKVLGEHYEKDAGAMPYIFSESAKGKEARHFKEHLDQTEAWSCTPTPGQQGQASPYWFQSWDNKNTRLQSLAHQRSELFLRDDVNIPEIIRKLVSLNSSYEYAALNHDFYHGVCGAGAPMHAHVAAWNALVFGKKMWSIHAPSRAVTRLDSPRAQVADFSEEMPRDAPYRCVQNAGDILIVPYMWSHSVLNLQESVGVAVQFKLGRKVAPPPSTRPRKKMEKGKKKKNMEADDAPSSDNEGGRSGTGNTTGNDDCSIVFSSSSSGGGSGSGECQNPQEEGEDEKQEVEEWIEVY
jgi:hypothetical protein